MYICALAIVMEIEGVNGESDVPCETEDGTDDDVLKDKGSSEGGFGLPSNGYYCYLKTRPHSCSH